MIVLIQDGDESAYRQEVKELDVWCSLNNLEINTLKTVEMIVDFRITPPPPTPLSLAPQCGSIQQRLYFLCQLWKFNLTQELLKQFCSAIIETILCLSIIVWFSSATKSDQSYSALSIITTRHKNSYIAYLHCLLLLNFCLNLKLTGHCIVHSLFVVLYFKTQLHFVCGCKSEVSL